MKYKAVITDLDGTAVDSPNQKEATKRLADAVHQLESTGIKVCAATGRAQSFAMPVLKTMGLTHPAIVTGGTVIMDPVSGAELWKCGLSKEQITQITSILKPFNYKYLWNDYTEDDYLKGGWPLKDFNDFDDTYFFEIVFVPNDEGDALIEALSGVQGIVVTRVTAQRPETNDYHITNAAATKEHAIYELEKIIGVDKSEMIGIGDGHNDLHLFKAVGLKVAMSNAVDDLKSAADKIIGDVKNDGLAAYFEELVKGEEL